LTTLLLSASILDALLCIFYRPFSFHPPATPEIYTLSLHDALPISTRQLEQVASHTLPFRPDERCNTLPHPDEAPCGPDAHRDGTDRKSTRLNSSHVKISYAVFCLKKKKKRYTNQD